MENQRCGQRDRITLEDMDKLKNKLKQGECLHFWEPVIYNDEVSGQAHHKYRRVSGLIVGIYPWLVQVKKKDGKLTSVTYVDILLWKKRGGNQREYEQKKQ